jgi:hypothetical protein
MSGICPIKILSFLDSLMPEAQRQALASAQAAQAARLGCIGVA